MDRALININSLSFKYDDEASEVLKEINLTISKGEWISIIGHNGSGKSTLAKFFNGLLIPGKPNTVLIEGYDPFYEKHIWQVRKKVGMVFQNPDNQIVATTVRDDIAFGLENIGIPKMEMLKRIDWALDKVKMSSFLDYEPHRLSGGQKQRLAIAGIIAMKPSVLILDEATSMLDPMGKQEVLDTIKQLNKNEEITVVNITHDLEETVQSDKIIIMNKGRISAIGSPQEIYTQHDKIIEAGLELPFSIQIQKDLMEKGYFIATTCLTKKDLVNELWKLNPQI